MKLNMKFNMKLGMKLGIKLDGKLMRRDLLSLLACYCVKINYHNNFATGVPRKPHPGAQRSPRYLANMSLVQG